MSLSRLSNTSRLSGLSALSDGSMSFMTRSQMGYTATGLVAGAFVWQIMARKKNWTYRPSKGIEWVDLNARALATWTGGKFAWASGFLTYLDLAKIIEEVRGASEDLLRPAWKVLTSWVDFFEGYLKVATKPAVAPVAQEGETAVVTAPPEPDYKRAWYYYLGSAGLVLSCVALFHFRQPIGARLHITWPRS
jgi:hypothetical protein